MVTGNHMKHTNTIFRKTCVSIGTWIFDLTCLLYGTITGRFMVPTSSQIVWSSGQSATQAVRLQQESCRSIKECEGKQTAKWWVSPDWTMFNYRRKKWFPPLGYAQKLWIYSQIALFIRKMVWQSIGFWCALLVDQPVNIRTRMQIHKQLDASGNLEVATRLRYLSQRRRI